MEAHPWLCAAAVSAFGRYVDHFMYKGHLCIITDYCEAGDLDRCVNVKHENVKGAISP